MFSGKGSVEVLQHNHDVLAVAFRPDGKQVRAPGGGGAAQSVQASRGAGKEVGGAQDNLGHGAGEQGEGGRGEV